MKNKITKIMILIILSISIAFNFNLAFSNAASDSEIMVIEPGIYVDQFKKKIEENRLK